MLDAGDTLRSDGGPSARHLVFIFLACVAVCAVFFSLGYLVGYNQRASKSIVSTENVSTPTVVPPVTNSAPASPASQETSAPQTAVNTPTFTPSPTPAEKPEPLAPSKATTLAAPSPTPIAKRMRSAATSALPSRTATPRRIANLTGAGYSVQVMASSTRADAESLAKILRHRGYPAFVLSARAVHAKDHLFRVLVGPYTARPQAELTLKKLEKEGFQPFIKH